MSEDWRDIEEYKDEYQVSSYGRVRSLTRYVRSKNGSFRKQVGAFVTLVPSNMGYIRVKLSHNGVAKWYFVHRLVAEAFIPNPENLPCVNHKDEDPKNNEVVNLEWCSYKYNSNYGHIKEKISKSNKGKKRSKEFCEHMRKMRRGTKLSEVTKLKIGLASRQNWEDMEYRNKVLKNRRKVM